jgi:hypothetical protein
MAFNGTGSNVTSLNAANIASGTLAVGRGGTGATTLNAAAVIIGNGTSAPTFVAPGTSGNVLTSNGSAWASTAPAGGGVTSLNGQTGAITNTDFNSIGSYTIAYSTTGNALNGTTYYAQNVTVAGSTLRLLVNTSASAGSPPSTPINQNALLDVGFSGTWRRMTAYKEADQIANDFKAAFLFVRVS